MSIIIFTGPTISISDASNYLDAIYLPPVKYGDVYRITELFQPSVIGIIDGYFNQVPAVWHKEILWAISQGAIVYGASSMGALRAAELAPLGMIGHGKIFQAYQQGVLPPYVDYCFEDDDEVAVTHAPAQLAYQALSEAMVNIRVTLNQACQQQLINITVRDQLIQLAKNEFYPNRSYANLLSAAKAQGIDTHIITTLRTWLEDHKVDQKKQDAIGMLKLIAQQLEQTQPAYTDRQASFQHTSQWQVAIDEIDQSHRIEHQSLDELRLLGQDYLDELDKAVDNLLPKDIEIEGLQNLSQFHQQPDQLQHNLCKHWQKQSNRLILNQFSINELEQLLLNRLKTTNRLSELEQRAEHKSNTLKKITQSGIHQLSELDKLQLSDWYFSERLKLELPDQLDKYAYELGFIKVDDFYAMILQEYYYLQELNGDG